MLAPKKVSTETDHRTRIAGVVRWLEDNLDEPIEIEALASRAAYAKHHFHRVFRGVTGESVAAHVRRLRLERAARELLRAGIVPRGASSVTDVALRAGYEAPEAFTRAFVQAFGVAPSEFRALPPSSPSRVPDPDRLVAMEIRTEPAIAVVALRHVGSWATVGETFGVIVSHAVKVGAFEAGARLYGLCPDDPEVTAEEHLRFDACLSLESSSSSALPPNVAFERREIPGGTYAVAVHVGPYDTLSATYLALIGHRVANSPYALVDEPVIEAYLNDPTRTAPADLRTEVRVRVTR